LSNKAKIPKSIPTNTLTKKKDVLGLATDGENSDEKNAYIALKYYDKSYEDLSEWQREELKGLSNKIDLINKLTWSQVKRNSSLRYKDVSNANKLPVSKNLLSEDITYCEMRITDKARIFGFRSNSIFFLCWLDRNHKICS
jgi:hypothetical protein